MSDVLGKRQPLDLGAHLRRLGKSILAAYLMKEHPQTAALILSKVKPSCAAKVMASCRTRLRNYP